MSHFDPIAIVGRACVLPGASSPDELFDAVRHGRVLITAAPDGAWGLDASRLIRPRSSGRGAEHVVSDRGGYVTGFDDRFDPDSFAARVERPDRLDPLTQWLLHCARVALEEARVDAPPPGSGLVVGNLSYPTVQHTRFVEDFWLGHGPYAPRPGLVGVTSDPRNRFSSGGPAHIVGRAFGLTGDVFALDAACASSLYALEIACRRLQEGAADLMLAGGVARADPLFIHLGFTALQALSPTGRSRPLHRGADGLLPAEGAGLVVLKRLTDAERAGDRIFGVIRAIGLSNDGRQSGFLAPALDGQLRAMSAAYRQTDVTPADIGFVECHATGTPRGDSVELDSLARVFKDGPRPAIGSLKANLGHPITASGVASLLKVLGAFEAKLLPPTPCDDPLPAIADYGFRLLDAAVPWESDGPRRAAISNFGFGGNNAHLIVEEWTGESAAGDGSVSSGVSGRPALGAASTASSDDSGLSRVAVVGIGVITGKDVGLPSFVDRLVSARDARSTVTDEIVLAMSDLGFPPNDLQESLAQQSSILAVLDEAVAQAGELDPDRTGVYIGMCVDPEAARHGLRVRLRELLAPTEVDVEGWRDANGTAARHLTAAGVIGCMPNIPANRVHARQDWTAPGFTVAGEELSGVEALALAIRALRAGEIDAAVVGASDFSHEPAHVAAARAVLPPDRQAPGDAAVALVLRRDDGEVAGGEPLAFLDVVGDGGRADAGEAAQNAGEAVQDAGEAVQDAGDVGDAVEDIGGTVRRAAVGEGSTVEEPPYTGPLRLSLSAEAGESEVTARFGHAHGASGLLHVAAAVVGAHLGMKIDRGGGWPAPRPPGVPHTRVVVESFSGVRRSVDVTAPPTMAQLISPVEAPCCRFYAAASVEELATLLSADVSVDRVGRWARGEDGDIEARASDGPRTPGGEPGARGSGSVRLAFVASAEDELDRLVAFAYGELIEGREPHAPGIFFGRSPMEGEVAFCYTGAAAAYAGAGRDLLLAFPSIGQRLCQRFAGTPKLAADLYGADVASFSPATQLTGSSFVCQAHTEFTRGVLGMRPEVAMGLSSGETNSLMAFGVWHDLDDMLAEIDRSEMYADQLTGACRTAAEFWGMADGDRPEWRNYRIAAPIEVIEAAMEGEDRVYVTVIHHYEDVVIGGDAAACERVVETVGRNRAIDLGLDMVVHCAPLEPFERVWHAIHERETAVVPDVRFYTNAGNRAYVPTREAAADAITRQAVDPVDFPKTVERAYADGVRIFVEHGPRAILTGAIARILGDRPHLAVALDPHGGAGLESLARSVARLWAVGVEMEVTWFLRRMTELRAGATVRSEPGGPLLRLRARAPDITWPESFSNEASPSGAAADETSPRETIVIEASPSEAVDVEPLASGAPDGPSYRDASGAGGARSTEPTSESAMSTATTPAPVQRMLPPPPADFDYDVASHFRTATSNGSSIAESEVPRRDRPGSAPRGPGRPASELSDPGLELIDAVAQTHADFLREQKETHERFLALVRSAASLPQERSRAHEAPRRPRRSSPSPRPSSGERARAGSPPAAEPSAAGAVRTADGPPSPVIPVAPPIDRGAMPSTFFLTREQLEVHASGRISDVFGELFERQDGYARQVRMPEPPLLFADRALTIEGEPGGMGQGRVVTETDVDGDAWYLHAGRMAPGVVIESGQADLLLISWLGADFLNKGERVYRLLGCDLTFFGELPAPGETLTYDIHVDGHAKTGDVRLFFFHYDCYIGDRLLISVRNGQAGFFSDEELAGSGGVLWNAEDDQPDPDARLDPPPRVTTKRSFSKREVQHWVDGDAHLCFGEGFELAACHTRTPTLPGGRLKLIDHVPVFDPEGGPWGRGYLRAESHVPVDAWFYQGHFKNDPCMPGTLMADAATQALSFSMAAMGFTIGRDGWRFEPVPGEMARFLCRGQVIPDADHRLEYEIFIEDIVDGDLPEVYASLLCKSDGFKVFQCRRFGLRLVPDYPLTTKREFVAGTEPPRLVGPGESDVRGDYEALLSCAWGRPSDAFGTMFTKFDGALKCPRLPGPPYHFMTSIVEVDVAPGSASEGGTLVSTYHVEPDAWYFDEGQGVMPFAVLVEALLQPCGWFASYLNFFADTEGDVAFRNLDGEECVLHRPVTPDTGTLKLTTRLTRFAKAAGTSIVFFEVRCEDDQGVVMTLTTDFGFFSPKVLEAQRGLPTTDEMRARRDEPSAAPTLSLADGGGVLAHLPGMASGKMRMLDEVTGFWPEAGEARLGRIRTEQRIHTGAWYFKAHFYEDPVQPGSLGLEALVQSARALAHLSGWLDGIDDPVWEQPIVGFPLAWRYRGQVVPSNERVITEVEALEVDIEDGSSVTVKVFGTQWVDGLRIYEVPSFAIRVRSASR